MFNYTIYTSKKNQNPTFSRFVFSNHCFSKDALHCPHSAKNKTQFIVNFAPEIQEIISESTYLGLLGYTVPTVALNVALKENKLIRYEDSSTEPLDPWIS